MLQGTNDSESKSTIKVVQDVQSPLIPEDAHVMTVLINHPPGAPGYPPHRLPGGPGFGYMIDGEMLFELAAIRGQIEVCGTGRCRPMAQMPDQSRR